MIPILSPKDLLPEDWNHDPTVDLSLRNKLKSCSFNHLNIDTNNIISNAKNDDYLVDVNYEFNNVIKFNYMGKSYVIKTAISSHSELSNEIGISYYGINRLRDPNFVTMIDFGFDIEYMNLVYDYVIYEFVEGHPFYPIYLYSMSYIKFKEVIYRIILSIYRAYKLIGFTHYDLYTRNIVIKPDNTPVIIDYGLSHISVKESRDHEVSHISVKESLNLISIGQELLYANVYNRTFWITDIFSLLKELYGNLRPEAVKNLDRNKYNLGEIKSMGNYVVILLNYFYSIRNDENIKTLIDALGPKYTEVLANESFERFLEYLSKCT